MTDISAIGPKELMSFNGQCSWPTTACPVCEKLEMEALQGERTVFFLSQFRHRRRETAQRVPTRGFL